MWLGSVRAVLKSSAVHTPLHLKIANLRLKTSAGRLGNLQEVTAGKRINNLQGNVI